MKRLFPLILCLCLLLPLIGCGLFDRTEYELSDYSPVTEEETAADSVGYISDYTALKRAIVWLVSEHEESAELQFQNYEGNISKDLSQACWEVKSSTPLGAFAVDYTSFDLSRIVSFYQADVFITYKRSAEQVEKLEQLAGLSALRRRLTQALSGGETYLVLQMTATSLTPEYIRERVQKAYASDALNCPVLPTVEVSLFPDSGVDRIAEITLNYNCTPEELAERRAELSEACLTLCADLLPDSSVGSDEPVMPDADTLYAAASRLTGCCTVSADAGSTAYDALVTGTSDAEGLALAYEALCQTLGADCQLVSGRLDNEDHCWNIVSLSGRSYHIDLTDLAASFLVGDDDIWGRRWWDTAAYPTCPQNYNYFGTVEIVAEASANAVPAGVTVG